MDRTDGTLQLSTNKTSIFCLLAVFYGVVFIWFILFILEDVAGMLPSVFVRFRSLVRQLLQYRGRERVGNARAVAHGVPQPGMEHPLLLLHQGGGRFFHVFD